MSSRPVTASSIGLRHLAAFVLIYPIVCIGLMVVLLNFAINSPGVRGEILDRVNQAIPGTIRYERLVLSLPPLRVHVYGLRLIHPRTGRSIIRAGELHATWKGSIFSLPKEVRLGNISLKDAACEILFDEEGKPTLLGIFVRPDDDEEEDEPDEEPGAFRLLLEGIDIHDLDFVLRRPEVEIEVRKASVRGRFALDDGRLSMAAQVTIPDGGVKVLDEHGQALLDIPIDGLQVRGWRWEDMGFSMEEARIVSGRVTAQTSGALWLGERPAFVGATKLSLPFARSFLAPLIGEAIDGTVQLDGSFFGLLDHALGSFHLTAPTLSVPGLSLGGLEVLGSLDGQEIDLSSVRAELLDGRMELSGRVRLLDGRVAGQARLHGLALDPFLPRGDARRVAAGRLSGQVHADARLWGSEPMEARARLDLGLARRDRELPLPRLLRLKTRGELKQGQLQLDSVELSGDGHRLLLDGWVKPGQERFDLALDLRSAPLAATLMKLGLEGMSGQVAFRGRAAGRFTDPGLRGELSLGGLTLWGHRLDQARGQLTLEQGTISLTGFSSRGRWGGLDLDTRVELWRGSIEQLLKDPMLDVAVSLSAVDLAASLPPELCASGKADLRVKVEGSLKRMEAAVELRTRAVTLRGLGLDSMELEAKLALQDELFALKVPHLAVGFTRGGELEGSGELRSDRSFMVDLRGQGVPIHEIERLVSLDSGVSGRIGFGFHGEGPLSAPEVTGDLLIRELSFKPKTPVPNREQIEDEDEEVEEGSLGQETLSYTLGNAQIHVDLGEEQVLRLSSHAAFGHYDIEASLPIDLSRSAPLLLDRAKLQILFEELPLAEVVPGLAERELGGHVTGSIRATMPRGRPAVELELCDLHLDVLSQEITNRREGGRALPVRLRFDGERFHIEQMELTSSGRFLSLGGKLDFHDGEEGLGASLDLRARGELDLAVLQPFVPELPRLGGILSFQLTLGGSPEAPRLEGSIGLQDARFQVQALAQELLLQRGRLFFSPGRVEIPPGYALVGRLGRRGAFSVQADLQVPQTWPLEIPGASVLLRAERLHFAFPEQGLQLGLDVPGVEIKGRDLLGAGRRIDIGGEIRVTSGQLIKSFTDPEALTQAIRGWFEGLEPSRARSLPADHPLLALQLRELELSGDEGAFLVQIQAAMLSLTLRLRPELAFSGGVDSLRISGSVDTLEGDAVMLMDREFRITRADIQFDGSVNPLVDLEAEAVVIAAQMDEGLDEELRFDASTEEERTYHITLYLKGRLPDDLEKFELISPQTSDQRELWTLLLLGYRYSDLSRSGRGGDVGSEVLLSSALQILSQKLSEGALRKFQLVDQLSLLAKRRDVKVEISKKVLGGKLELLGSGTFSGAESEQSLGAKLYLRDRLFLEFSTTPGSDHNPMTGRLGWQVPMD